MSQLEQYIEKWVGYLGDADHDMSLIAAKKLAKAKAPESIDALTNALNGRPDDIRITAARSLGEIGDKSAVRPLVYLLNDPNSLIASAAADALGEIGDRSAVPALIDVLKDHKTANRHRQLHGFDRGVFMAAVYALERINTVEARKALARYHR